MSVYEDFAYFYATGPYTQYSQRMAELLPGVLEHFSAQPKKVLDIACGEGTFSTQISKRGYQVTGGDQSEEMLHFAQERARKEDVEIGLLHLDMRSLPFDGQFDLVTCWFDSLNYLMELEDLGKTFNGVGRALKKGGLFIFDMNTIYGLAVNWQRYPAHVEQDTETVFVVHRPAYDYDHNIASMRITGFMQGPDGWFRMDEEHRERGYPLEQIRATLESAGLKELACWGSFAEKTPAQGDSGRVWFVSQK